MLILKILNLRKDGLMCGMRMRSKQSDRKTTNLNFESHFDLVLDVSSSESEPIFCLKRSSLRQAAEDFDSLLPS